MLFDHRMPLRHHTDSPAVVKHEFRDHVGADVRLARAGRTLDQSVEPSRASTA